MPYPARPVDSRRAPSGAEAHPGEVRPREIHDAILPDQPWPRTCADGRYPPGDGREVRDDEVACDGRRMECLLRDGIHMRTHRARTRRALGVCAILAGVPTGCGSETAVDVGSGVALELADRRAATIFNVHYDVRFSIPAARAEPIDGSITTSFTLTEVGPLVFDFAQPAENVHAVRVAGAPVDFEAREEHVIVPAEAMSPGHNVVDIEFTAGDGSLNRQDDFLYTLFVPDRARVAFPLFDQPNLKARFRLQLDVPAAWRAVANGSLASREGTRRPGVAHVHRDPRHQQLSLRLRRGGLPGGGSGARRTAHGDVPPRDRPREGRAQRRRHIRPARVRPGVAGGVHRYRRSRSRSSTSCSSRPFSTAGWSTRGRSSTAPIRCCSTRAPPRTRSSAGPA